MNYEIEPIGWKNEEIITFFTGIIVLLMTFINLKQMSFIARFVMIVTLFVIAWTSFDAFFKFYITSYMKEGSPFNYRIPQAPPNKTIEVVNTTVPELPHEHAKTKSGFSIMEHLSVFKGGNSTMKSSKSAKHHHKTFNEIHHFPYVAPPPHLHF